MRADAQLTKPAEPARAVLQTRAGTIVPASFNVADNTVDVVFSTGSRGVRYSWDSPYDEELEVTPEAVDMSRIDAGVVHVVDAHMNYGSVRNVLGVVLRAWIEKGAAMATLKLSEREDVRGITSDIKAGIIRAVSVAYSVDQWERVPAELRTDGIDRPLQIAKRWTPQEISFVIVPFDLGASVRSGDALPFNTRQGTTMETATPQPAAQPLSAEHQQEINELCTRHGAGGIAASLIERRATIDQARQAVLDHLGTQDRQAGGHINVSPIHSPLDAANQGHGRDLMIEALSARMSGRVAKGENPYRHHRVLDVARECLELRGIRTTAMSASQLIERSLATTSDFPELLKGAGQRTLRAAYMSYQGGLKRACRESSAKDFRAKQKLMLGEAPDLLKVGEASEFKRGAMAEAKSSYSIDTYGRIFGITRQALINDDLDAFGDMAARLGRAAAEFEAKFLVTLLTSNPVMPDTIALFHASHGNLLTGVGSALSETSLSDARKAMRLQKGLDGKTPIDATPRYLVVPAALETTAEKLIATITPAQSADVNPFAGKLEPVVDPRLDAVSVTAWYLAADANIIDTIEYSYLESSGGPEVITREGFDVDGLEMKVRLDYGAGVVDFRGLLKSAGA